MKHVDVVSVVQNAVAQALGEAYLTQGDGKIASIESFKLADVGKDVLDSGSVENYTKTLLTQLGRMEIESDVFKDKIGTLNVPSEFWYGYMERVKYDIQDILDDAMYYGLVDGQTYDDHVFYEPKVKAKIFEEIKTFKCPMSFVDDGIQESFTSWEQMNGFLEGIRASIRSTLNLGIMVIKHSLLMNGIAVSVSGTQTAVHLITEFYGANSGKTYADVKKDKEFLAYVNERIANIKEQMEDWNIAHANGSIPTFAVNVDVTLLSEWANNTKFNLLANTYNPNDIGIGDFDRVTTWQAFKDTSVADYGFATASKVSIAADATNKLGIGTSAFEQGNVIGLIRDHRALGICPFREKVTSNYTASADFYNQYLHVQLNTVLDADYKMVALVLD